MLGRCAQNISPSPIRNAGQVLWDIKLSQNSECLTGIWLLPLFCPSVLVIYYLRGGPGTVSELMMLPSLVRLTYGSQPTFIGQVLQFELTVCLSLRFLQSVRSYSWFES